MTSRQDFNDEEWVRIRRAPLVAGVAISLDLCQPWWSALLLGSVTAVTGGIVRDVLRNEVPFVLLPGE